MSPSIWIVFAVVVIGFVIWRLMIPSLTGVVAKAQEEQDISPIVDAVEGLREAARPAAYNHAIRKIWDAYNRELAIELVIELAKKHNDSLIAQYWLKQVIQVEPELTRSNFSREFLADYFQPEVADQCGPVG